MSDTAPQNVTEHETAEVERANRSGLQPVVFVHGLWLLPSSWDRWATHFEEAGFTPLTPGWPDDPDNPDRGPLLIINGEKDHTIPWSIANASYTQQAGNEGVTEIVEIPNRGHALTIDSGWREVADTALKFVQRFV
jgi:pimeloyl-ACP methyl ester carboxylesterase